MLNIVTANAEFTFPSPLTRLSGDVTGERIAIHVNGDLDGVRLKV